MGALFMRDQFFIDSFCRLIREVTNNKQRSRISDQKHKLNTSPNL